MTAIRQVALTTQSCHSVLQGYGQKRLKSQGKSIRPLCVTPSWIQYTVRHLLNWKKN
jgi:hypothetical protein